MADPLWVSQLAADLIHTHLSPGWTFRFDSAKTRAGLCNHSTQTISLSRYLASRYLEDDTRQVLLHEIAHALAGAGAGHGPRWKSIATELGYTGRRLHDGEIAHELAPWLGACPAGHAHYRYRRPARALSCGTCARRFDSANAITWTQRTVR